MQQQRFQHRAIRLLPQHVEVDLVQVVRPVQRVAEYETWAANTTNRKMCAIYSVQARFSVSAAANTQPLRSMRPAIGQPGAVPGQQHEHLGRIAQGEVAQAELIDPVGRDVVEEDPPQRQAAEQVHPQVAAGADQPHAVPPAPNLPVITAPGQRRASTAR